MFEEIKKHVGDIELVLNELDRYKTFKKNLLNDLELLNKQYAKKQFGFKTYKDLKFKLLEGKTKKEQLEYYNASILSLVKRLEYINTQIFSLIYDENPKKRLFLHKPKKSFVKIIKKRYHVKGLGKIPDQIDEELPKSIVKVDEAKVEAGVKEVLKGEKSEILKPDSPVEAKVEFGKDKPIEKKAVEAKAAPGGEAVSVSDKHGKAPKPIVHRKRKAPKPKKKGIGQTILDAISGKKEQDVLIGGNPVGFGSVFSLDFIRNLIKRFTEKETYIAKKTAVGESLLDFSEVGHIDFEEESRTSPNLLVKQAKQLKQLLKRRNIKIHNTSILGTVANVSVRQFSIYLIDKFPDFFKNFYVTLRHANTKVLSNTYVNIMVFTSLIMGFLFIAASIIFSLATSNPFYLLVSQAFLMFLLGVGLSTAALIYYPHVKIKKRVRSINTNLPFAIDHMSSLVASGVPPAAMFRLLSKSTEYDEVSKEIEKISNFIDIFGYDLLTAIRSIAATTPAPSLKEFFDGLVATVESGGSLKNYLTQKSKEAMLTYRLERQKYVESLSTYSDIYTGVLIAAPLFFVSALSLVSMLGGNIGNYSVDTVIAFGTYVIIPALNIMFILFLEMNQPEI